MCSFVFFKLFQEIMFQVLGGILFLISGAFMVERYQNILSEADGDVGLALGSMLIITSIFMFIDVGILSKERFSKK